MSANQNKIEVFKNDSLQFAVQFQC